MGVMSEIKKSREFVKFQALLRISLTEALVMSLH